MKICTSCEIEKELSEFNKGKSHKDGLQYKCRSCHSKYYKQYNSRPGMKEYLNEKSKKYRKTEKYQISRKKHWRKNRLKWNYNLTVEEHDKMLIDQNYSCKICKRHESEFHSILNIDHNHETGKVRGLLCEKCNKGMGLLKEDIQILKNMIQYLEEYK